MQARNMAQQSAFKQQEMQSKSEGFPQ
jgi:hypothetical protein